MPTNYGLGGTPTPDYGWGGRVDTPPPDIPTRIAECGLHARDTWYLIYDLRFSRACSYSWQQTLQEILMLPDRPINKR